MEDIHIWDPRRVTHMGPSLDPVLKDSAGKGLALDAPPRPGRGCLEDSTGFDSGAIRVHSRVQQADRAGTHSASTRLGREHGRTPALHVGYSI